MQVYELRSLEEGAGKNLCVKLDSILGYTTSIAFITASRSITILAIIIRVRIVRIHVFIYLSLLWLLLSVLLILLRILYVTIHMYGQRDCFPILQIPLSALAGSGPGLSAPDQYWNRMIWLETQDSQPLQGHIPGLEGRFGSTSSTYVYKCLQIV